MQPCDLAESVYVVRPAVLPASWFDWGCGCESTGTPVVAASARTGVRGRIFSRGHRVRDAVASRPAERLEADLLDRGSTVAPVRSDPGTSARTGRGGGLIRGNRQPERKPCRSTWKPARCHGTGSHPVPRAWATMVPSGSLRTWRCLPRSTRSSRGTGTVRLGAGVRPDGRGHRTRHRVQVHPRRPALVQRPGLPLV